MNSFSYFLNANLVCHVLRMKFFEKVVSHATVIIKMIIYLVIDKYHHQQKKVTGSSLKDNLYFGF